MKTWNWVDPKAVRALHEEQLNLYGGPPGVRDAGAIVSALARPLNLVSYGEPDAAALAASYAFGLARNHGFVDGNKRIAFIVAVLFIEANELTLHYEDDEAIAVMLALAAGEISENALADWFRERIVAP